MFVVMVEDVSCIMNLLFQPLWLQLDYIGNWSAHFSGPWRQGQEASRPSSKTEGAAEAIDTLHLRVMEHAPGPLNDLDSIIRSAHNNGQTFVEIPLAVAQLKHRYMARQNINPRRWEVTRIAKLRQKTSPFKHQFIVARLECQGEDGVHIVRYLRLDRTKEKRSGNSPGLHISGPSGALNHAHIFSADDPGTNAANETLMTLVPGDGPANDEALEHPVSLPDILVLGHQIHNISPRYQALSANCYWFADAMPKALERYGFQVIQGQQPGEPSRWNRLVNFVFHKSVSTDEQINQIFHRFINARDRFFDFQDEAI
ncbi:hypothetical protein JOM56_000693 [Amanita muscaria]